MSVTAARARMSTPKFTPASVADLAAWYDAGRIPAVADGAAVTSWADLSVNGRDLTQSNADSKPMMKRGVVNGRDAVRFGTAFHDDYMQTAAFTLPQPTTLLCVAKVDDLADTTFLLDGLAAGRQAIFADAASWKLYAGSVVAGGTSATGWHVFCAVFNGASSVLRVDTTQVIAANPGAGSLAGLTLGSAGDTPGAFLDGDVAELCVYGRALTSTERGLLEQHLTDKYDL